MDYRGYIFDLDGTLYRGNGRSLALRRRSPSCDGGDVVREAVVFLSNKPLERRQAYAEKLTHLGIPTSPDKVMEERLVAGPGPLPGQQRTWNGRGHSLCLS